MSHVSLSISSVMTAECVFIVQNGCSHFVVGPLFNIRLTDTSATYIMYVQSSSSDLLKVSTFGLVQYNL